MERPTLLQALASFLVLHAFIATFSFGDKNFKFLSNSLFWWLKRSILMQLMKHKKNQQIDNFFGRNVRFWVILTIIPDLKKVGKKKRKKLCFFCCLFNNKNASFKLSKSKSLYNFHFLHLLRRRLQSWQGAAPGSKPTLAKLSVTPALRAVLINQKCSNYIYQKTP